MNDRRDYSWSVDERQRDCDIFGRDDISSNRDNESNHGPFGKNNS